MTNDQRRFETRSALAPLLPLIAREPTLLDAHAQLDAGGRAVLGTLDAAKPAVAAALWHRSRRPVLLLVAREGDAEAAVEQLRAWAGDSAVLYPSRGLMPYAREAPSPAVTAQRLAVLAALARGAGRPLLVASVAATVEHTLGPHDLGLAPGEVRAGDRLSLDALATRLVRAGYAIEPIVEQPGEAARRGGLLDVFPPGAAHPVRIEFFGDEVESLRAFDVETQRTLGRVDAVALPPASEWLAARDRLATLALALERTRSEAAEDERHALQSGTLPAPGRYGPLAAEHTLLDHLPADALVILDERESIEGASGDLDTLARERRADLAAQGDLGAEAPLPHLSQAALLTALEQRRPRVELARWATGRERDALRLPWQQADAYAGRLPEAAADLARQLRRGDRVVVVSQQAQRFAEVLAEQGISVAARPALDVPPAPGELTLLQGALTDGWRVAAEGGQLALVTDRELFGFVKKRRTLPRRGTQREKFFAEIEPGDIVVHADHGVARFAGIVRRPLGDEERDYLELRFAAGDRLYVPTDQVSRVTRYVGPSGHAPRLTRLGTQEWTRTRARVRAAVEIVAADLLRLYAARQLLEGHAFAADTPWQQEMEAAFPYEETDDQLRAIAEVKADMESERPMDRVVCGDVGFGKTEVGVRAAFKAVQDGFQVAMLVPTTVLAQQHERTFRERLASFPVRIEVLSRFRTEEETRQVLSALRAGEVDIVIGTHRLLQNDVEFANLGLVVIDEEQRFGVTHKERLKRMRLEVDVLTLSATPIPRTMHMALTGIRDMSSIDTAPVERQPVQTYVTEFDPALVREAILHEVERGGQVYAVHNRVHSIDEFADRLRELVPEARVVVGHGQMPEGLLKRVMERFAEGEYDVLVCTTIIESGIDIPNVNTLIVDRADRFGLAQLYQLRGRVGRSTHQAYAYLLHSRERPLTDTAQQRLATIFEATELGAGFQVALRDLEIRGAGNLLGAEQSGQIATVGFELYTEMLAEAVADLRKSGGAPERRAVPAAPELRVEPARLRQVRIDLPVAAYLPESYVPEIEARLALYQRVAGLASLEEVDALRAESEDRLGPLPPPVDALLRLVRIRIAAARAGVAAVRVDGDEVVVVANDDAPFALRRLPRLPAGVDRRRSQLRVPRGALGEAWIEAVEALLLLIGAPDATPARAVVGAAR